MKMLADSRVQQESERRIKRLFASYRKLAEDPHYKAIVDENKAVLGEQLRLLIDRAAKCRHCAPIASRIVVLQDVVVVPMEMLLFERQQSDLAAEDAQDEVDAEEVLDAS